MGDEQPTLPDIPVPPAPSDATPEDVTTTTATPRRRPTERTQRLPRSVVVEALIAEGDPARAIWAFVGRLDLTRYLAQVKAVEGAAGRPLFVRPSAWRAQRGRADHIGARDAERHAHPRSSRGE